MTAAPPRKSTAAKRQPKKKNMGDIPKRQQNGYYADHTTGDRLRSVTTILNGGVPKDSLTPWAAWVTVDAAIDALPKLLAAVQDRKRHQERLADLRAWLGRAHTQARDERGDIGTAVHKVIEAKILDQPIPDTIVIGEGERKQRVRLDGPEMKPYVDNFLRFVDDWQVVFTASEMVVANYTDHYAGTLDYTIASDGLIARELRAAGYEIAEGEDLMGDTKTGGSWERERTKDGRTYLQCPALTSAGHIHGVYPEAGLQMSAYRKGEQCWLRDGTKVPMPPTASVGIVLHLRPEGYRLYPALCGDDVFHYFLYAQQVDAWTSKVASAKADRPIVGPALELPATVKKGAA